MSTSKIVTLDALTLYHQQMKEYVDTEDDNGAGLNVEGESFDVKYVDVNGNTVTETIVASAGAEIFNHVAGGNKAIGTNSHAEGYETIALASSAHTEGWGTQAVNGRGGHAEGLYTQAFSTSHAEGTNTKAFSDGCHAEGTNTIAHGGSSHAEGCLTYAHGNASHAEGFNTQSVGNNSHSEGYYTVALDANSHAMGKFNRTSNTPANFAFVIGNGTSDSSRSDAFAIDWDGKVYVGNSTTGIDISTLVHETITEDDIDALFA